MIRYLFIILFISCQFLYAEMGSSKTSQGAWTDLPSPPMESNDKYRDSQKRGPASYQYCINSNGLRFSLGEPGFDNCRAEKYEIRDVMVLRHLNYEF